jgi:hypothetical protein
MLCRNANGLASRTESQKEGKWKPGEGRSRKRGQDEPKNSEMRITLNWEELLHRMTLKGARATTSGDKSAEVEVGRRQLVHSNPNLRPFDSLITPRI